MRTPTYTAEILSEMRELASQGLSSQEAWQRMRDANKIGATSLSTFRVVSSTTGISWGGHDGGIVIGFKLKGSDHDIFENAAVKYNTTPGILARKLIQIITRENLFEAILDGDKL